MGQPIAALLLAASGAIAAQSTRPVALDRRGAGMELELPPASGSPVETTAPIPISGPWRMVGTSQGIRTWEVPLPARTRTLFFHRPPSGMKLVRRTTASTPWTDARPVKHSTRGNTTPDTWEFDTHSLRIRRRATAGPPPVGQYALRFPRGQERENSLRQADPSDPEAFVVRSLQLDDTTRHGLFLAPGTTVRVSVDVPPDGELRFQAMGVPPEAADPSVVRDGQSLQVQLLPEAGPPVSLVELRPPDGLTVPQTIDLSPWAGQTVSVELRAPTDGNDLHDAVFVADPVVLQPDPSPPLMVVLFIDTLRQDALSIYGNPQPTSPGIDAWAQDATVFTQARSVAPWTLPTARTLFSGHAPERWGQVPDLPTRLREAGWATAFIAGNIYLSSNFDMANGWTEHRCINWPQAEVQVRRAERWLDAHADRPAMLVLHLMDMHLPYTEPASFRDRFAGPTPEPFTADSFQRNQVVQWERALTDDSRAWLRGRYHNNLAYIDSVVTPFLEELPPHATVVLLSDHGEEFWDHGEFEHGHSLYDELLKVPLIAKGPGLPAGRTDTPASLLDVAPTLLHAAGLDVDLDGIPLQSLATDDPSVHAARAIGFGRPLYGDRRWGVVQGSKKYTTWRSTETLVDLAADPSESTNLMGPTTDRAHWHQVLSEALRTPVHIAYTIAPQRSSKAAETRVEVHVPGGILAAWAGEDPTQLSEVHTTLTPTTAVHTWTGKKRGTRQAYVVPQGNAAQELPTASIEVRVGTATGSLPVPAEPPVMDGRNHILGRVRVGGRSVSLQMSVVPLPPTGSVGIDGFDAEVEAELEALGYLDH